VKTKLAALAALVAVLAAARPSTAQSPRDLEQAKTLFNAGAQAYSAGRYEAAVQAFEDAYKLAPRSSVLFSFAQAEKKLYFAAKKPEMARRALEHYRKYLTDVPEGGRRNDATDAIAELEPIVARLDPQSPAVAQPEAPKRAKLYVTSTAETARVFLDGKPIGPAPFVGDVEPGRHKVRVSAEGYFDVERDVIGDLGNTATVDAVMPERPAPLIVDVASSCDVYVDGKLVGAAPFARPVDVAPGAHALAVVKNGSRLFSQEITLERGKPATVKVVLERSPQRTFSWFVLGTGAATAVVGGAFGLVSLGQEGKAKDLAAERAQGNVDASKLSQYNKAIEKRDAFRTAFYATSGAGLGVLAVGAWLYLFDKPDPAFVPRGGEKRDQPKKLDVDLAAAPFATPEGGGAAVFGRF